MKVPGDLRNRPKDAKVVASLLEYFDTPPALSLLYWGSWIGHSRVRLVTAS